MFFDTQCSIKTINQSSKQLPGRHLFGIKRLTMLLYKTLLNKTEQQKTT